jgi:hypothetical protein
MMDIAGRYREFVKAMLNSPFYNDAGSTAKEIL